MTDSARRGVRRRLGYLSGAPRVSTRANATTSGPRAHILGFTRAVEALGWEVAPFIVGDRLPSQLGGDTREAPAFQVTPALVAADLARLAMGWINSRRAWRELGVRVDWVYERFAVMQALGRPFQRHGVPWILETNGLFFSEARIERKSIAWASLARRLEISAYRDCDVLVCVTDTLKRALMEEAGVPAEKIVVVPNAVDPEFFHPDRHAQRRLLDGVVVGFVGSLIEWQGIDVLLDVLAELKRDGIQLSLVVVGDGTVRASLEAKSRDFGLASHVRFVGRVPFSDVPSYIAGFDFGYSGHRPLQRGGMYHSPLKLFEYMAMAKPVVAALSDDSRAVVRDGETGFLFDSAHSAALRRALQQAFEAREKLPEMGRKARALVSAEHSWIARVKDMVPEIERVLARK